MLIISTGGTFNKRYNPLDGTLLIDQGSTAIESIATRWLCELEVVSIIGRDSLDMGDEDRELLIDTIRQTRQSDIIIVHGTDTMDITAKAIADANLSKCIVITGAMVPYSIDPIEATANLCSAYGYIQAIKEHGVYIAMNRAIGSYRHIRKDRGKGRFRYSNAVRLNSTTKATRLA